MDELKELNNLESAMVSEIARMSKGTKRKEGIDWDVPIDHPIDFFDPNLSYELTGYRPINRSQGLDFDPNLFTVCRSVKLATGRYSSFIPGTKSYSDFWRNQYKICRDGITINGYTITGHHYFFLNYYQLPNLNSVSKLGSGRIVGFPDFYVAQYEYFHYVDLCMSLGYNILCMKARGVGFSEIAASIAVNTYNCRRNGRVVVAAEKEGYVSATLDKCWLQLNNLNSETEGGFRKLRQKHDTLLWKKSSSVNRDGKEDGYMSEIEGIIADKPNKIRGDRTDVLIYEESGSWKSWTKAFLQGDALIAIQGKRFGIKIAFGTGGDSGPALEGLSKAYYNPISYDVLPFRHSYTADKKQVLTSFFLPSYKMVNTPGYVDSRGFCDPERGLEFYNKERKKKEGSPNALLIYSAEYCFTAEEAFALEGENMFNSVLIAEQLINIRLHKQGPKPERGYLEYTFNGGQSENTINGFKWLPKPTGKVVILEHPVKDTDGSNFNNLYVAGIDSIDLGGEDTSAGNRDPSDFCIVIKKRSYGLEEPKYVAYYKDRPENIFEAYKIALRLLEYYNAKAVLESTKISLLSFFRERRKETRYLMRRPRATMADILGGNSKQFGAPATEVIIKHQLELISRYVNDYCHNIWLEPMLDELQRYSYENKTKFDMVAAMGMAELGDEELHSLIPVKSNRVDSQWRDIGYYTDENGVKRYGVLPDKKNSGLIQQLNVANEERWNRTSDTRYV